MSTLAPWLLLPAVSETAHDLEVNRRADAFATSLVALASVAGWLAVDAG